MMRTRSSSSPGSSKRPQFQPSRTASTRSKPEGPRRTTPRSSQAQRAPSWACHTSRSTCSCSARRRVRPAAWEKTRRPADTQSVSPRPAPMPTRLPPAHPDASSTGTSWNRRPSKTVSRPLAASHSRPSSVIAMSGMYSPGRPSSTPKRSMPRPGSGGTWAASGDEGAGVRGAPERRRAATVPRHGATPPRLRRTRAPPTHSMAATSSSADPGSSTCYGGDAGQAYPPLRREGCPTGRCRR